MALKASVASIATLLFSSLTTVAALPSVEGPITGGSRGYPFCTYLGNITELGYVEEEYFISGEATRYNVIGNFTVDGHWTLTPNDTLPYKTRILVRRPINARKFNGDVILEWINVSGGYDLMVSDGPGVYEAGYAFVGVSVQYAGLIGFAPTPIGLTEWDPERYGTLSIPDDALSYDIYTQAAAVLRHGTILGGPKPNNIISIGESQSGIRVIAYANGVQPLTNAFDAIIPVITAGNSADFSSVPATSGPPSITTYPTQIRTDLTIPVFELNTETEAMIYYLEGLRQPDTNLFRYWELTGGSHANTPLLQIVNELAARDGLPVATIPSNLDTISWLTALDAIYPLVSRWVTRTAVAPPEFPKMSILSNGTDLARDANGNTIGGIRIPDITVPIAAYDGESAALFGTTTPFSAATLRSLYPTHSNYVNKVVAAANIAVLQKIILPYRAEQYIQTATTANIPPS
ncbi:hypothetical protein B7463_g11724, partial [Scytalidium lignicola]